MYIVCGEQERLQDGTAMLAKGVESQGATVVWEEWEGMCHDFVVYLPGVPHSRACLERCAKFVRRCFDADAKGSGKVNVESEGWRIDVEILEAREVDFGKLECLTYERAKEVMMKARDEREAWTGMKTGGDVGKGRSLL